MGKFRRFYPLPQPVSHGAKPFIDDVDSTSDFYTGGAPFPALAPAAPRSLVRRLLDIESSGNPDRLFWRGYGAREPHVSVRDSVRRSVAPSFRRGAVSRSPLQAHSPSDSWAAFRKLKVSAPARVMFCVRRRQRREVLFAFGVPGKRGLRGAGGHYKRNAFSSWSC